MSKTRNYECLKQYLPQEDFDENFALLSHYIQLQNTEAGNAYLQKLLDKIPDLILAKFQKKKILIISYSNNFKNNN